LLDIAVVVAFAVALSTVATTPNLVFLGGIGFMMPPARGNDCAIAGA